MKHKQLVLFVWRLVCCTLQSEKVRVSKRTFFFSRSSSAGRRGLQAGALSKGGRIKRVRNGWQMWHCALAVAGGRLALHMTHCWDFFSSVKEKKTIFVSLIENFVNWKLGIWYLLQLFSSDYLPWQTTKHLAAIFLFFYFFCCPDPFQMKSPGLHYSKKHLKPAASMILENNLRGADLSSCLSQTVISTNPVGSSVYLSQVTVWSF